MSYRFIVSGRGLFPFDMLRFDCAFPCTTTSAFHLRGEESREVILMSDRRPTVERWRSFGWVVTDVMEM